MNILLPQVYPIPQPEQYKLHLDLTAEIDGLVRRLI